ncbi:hypothetical protein CVT26_014797 [Gymnopilus dilepis]|uniref:F-box domain-containing protein n=1 Tax=Gymnopilus dilepis TaxID=231916 RepID=A0A409W3Y3_9AGAR|nr:hypothetical protein CVT26_014797 [Gymnopilus dilepis]
MSTTAVNLDSKSPSSAAAGKDPRLSPISELSYDVLWLIFEQNTFPCSSTDPIRPLSTCIRTSGVCKFWRDIMLQSPIFWGRLIDLGHPFMGRRIGRGEVLKRSGVAPLWLQGTPRNRIVNDFFFSTLQDHWERVEVFDVKPFTDGRGSPMPADQLWATLLRPAPLLRVFRFPAKCYTDLFSKSPVPLFSNEAPRIEEFSVGNVSYSLEASWMSTIRDVYITPSFKLKDVLRGLKGMKAMRRMKTEGITMATFDVVSDADSRVFFDHLQSLEIYDSLLPVWLRILENIACKLPCILHLKSSTYSYSNAKEPPETTLQIACEHLFRFLNPLLVNSPASWVSFKLSKLRVPVWPYPLQFEMSFLNDHQGNLASFDFGGYPGLSLLFVQYLSSSLLLSSAIRLDLDIEENDLSIFAPEFHLMMSKFESVTILEIPEHNLDLLIRLCDPHIFPSLQILHLTGFISRPTVESVIRGGSRREEELGPNGLFGTFLQKRISVGAPISLLDLVNPRVKCSRDMAFLDEVSGLTVRYWDYESGSALDYVCGSGNPDALRFSFFDWDAAIARYNSYNHVRS